MPKAGNSDAMAVTAKASRRTPNEPAVPTHGWAAALLWQVFGEGAEQARAKRERKPTKDKAPAENRLPRARRPLAEHPREEASQVAIGLRAHDVILPDRVGRAGRAEAEDDLAQERA